jgi:hypothetical protein
MARQQEDHVRLDMLSSSLLDQGDHLQASLVNENPFSTPLKGKTSSFTSVFMNSASNSTNREKDRA